MNFYVSEISGGLHTLEEKQAFRYMGMAEIPQAGELRQLYDRLLPQFLDTITCRACYAVVPVSVYHDSVDLSVMTVTSGDLSRNLKGCSYAVLFAATLGMASERQRKRAAAISPTQALVLDGMGSAAIERFCDYFCTETAKQYPSFRLRPRFSPGYGDFPLEIQSEFLRILDAQRKIGVFLSDGGLMLPQKSVTAVVGLAKDGCEKETVNCEDCGQMDCEFRL